MTLFKRRLGNGGAGAGSPSAYGGIGVSPMKRKSPFKRRISGASKADTGAGVSANIRVAVRVRPENQKEVNGGWRNVIEVVDDRMLIFDPKDEDEDFFFQGKRQNQRRDLNKVARKDHKFAFDSVLGPDASNQDVYEATTKDLVDVVFQGYNCSVFVYGATGAGKTHTMLGTTENPGITFRTVMDLYKRIEEISEESSCKVAVSYLEVYNETIIDLINPSSGQLAMREDGKNSVSINNLSVHRPSGPEDLLQILQTGNANRRQHPTDANKESSRSHAVFQVTVEQKARLEGLSGSVKVAKLSMIDLAGSEKGSATFSREKARVREGANINKSLLALGNCINALAEGSKYIPYRNSKLTRLLKDSIGGNCRTVMISNVSPSSMSFEDTYNTLRYADRAKKIKMKLQKNVMNVNFHVGQYGKIVDDLKAEINILKRKNVKLQEENEELLDQVKNVAPPPPADHEELERLREEIRVLKEEKVKEKPSKKVSGAISNFISSLKKSIQEKSQIKLMEFRRKIINGVCKRGDAISVDGEEQGRSLKKLKQYNLIYEKRIAKSLKRHRKTEAKVEDAKCEAEAALKDVEEIERLKFEMASKLIEEDMTKDHLLDVIKTLFLEQERTEEILLKSLGQLKRSHLILRGNGLASSEIILEFQDLTREVGCENVRFRDGLIVETNLDEPIDRINSPFRSVVDIGVKPTTPQCSRPAEEPEEDVEEPVIFDLKEEEGDETFVEPEVKQVWKPPTPPKSSPSTIADPISVAAASIKQNLDETFEVGAKKLNFIREIEEGEEQAVGSDFDVSIVNKTFDVNQTFDVPHQVDLTVVLEEPSSTVPVPVVSSYGLPDVLASASPVQRSDSGPSSTSNPELPSLHRPKMSSSLSTSSLLRGVKKGGSGPKDLTTKPPSYMAATTSSTRRFSVISSVSKVHPKSRSPFSKSLENERPSSATTDKIPASKLGFERPKMKKGHSLSALRQLNK